MCGIVGVISKAPVNQLIYDALLLLQHRGQDAAGIVTMQGTKCFMHKARGMVRDVFRTRNMRALPGTVGLGQVRYPTAGNAYSEEEAQPFYVNAPFGIVLVHNGNLTNAHALQARAVRRSTAATSTPRATPRCCSTSSRTSSSARRAACQLTPEEIFSAVRAVHERVRGSYAVVALIAGHGLLAFRDPVRHPAAVLRRGRVGRDGREVMVASESVAIEGTGHAVTRDVAPGEAVFIDLEGRVHARQCADNPQLNPCMFEYVYLARPDSVMDGISVYQARLEHGRDAGAAPDLARCRRTTIDVVIPIPESSRPSAMQLAQKIGKPYREGFVKNRYVGRTFIMPGQGVRKKSVRQKLNAIDERVQGPQRAAGRRLDRARHDQQRDRADGARSRRQARSTWPARRRRCATRTCTASTCRPPSELIAHDRSVEEIREFIGADALIYQDVDAMKRVVGALNPKLDGFEASCFDGAYVTGDISAEEFAAMREAARKPGRRGRRTIARASRCRALARTREAVRRSPRGRGR